MQTKAHTVNEKERMSTPITRKLRLGIIGCGYVTRNSHLPASSLLDSVDVVALVDVHLDRARKIAEMYDVPNFTSRYQDLFDEVDAVIVAVPHHLHAPIAIDFLTRGIHVLCEKPMSISSEECRQMIDAAEYGNAKLAVGHMRRFYDSTRVAKRLIDTHFLGEVIHFEAEEAVLFERFPASPFTLEPPAGGVLFDTGAHTLDLLLWWMRDFADICYWDDRGTGVEANCRIELRTESGATGTVELSRTRNLANSIRVHCTQGMFEVSTHNPSEISVHSPRFSKSLSISSTIDERKRRQLTPFFARQLDNFVGAIQDREELVVPGEVGLACVSFLERCLQVRESLEVMPWAQLDNRIVKRL